MTIRQSTNVESDEAHIATWLKRAANEVPPRPGLPSASHLWWRAQIIRDLVHW